MIKLNTSVDVIVGGDSGHLRRAGDDTYVSETIGDGEWFFGFSGSADFFGLATLNATGWVDSKGHFGVDLNGGITIGGGCFGLSGNFDVSRLADREQHCASVRDDTCEGRRVQLRRRFSADVDVNAFGLLARERRHRRDASTAHGTGTVDLVASVEVQHPLPLLHVLATANFDIGTVQLPNPIYLAGRRRARHRPTVGHGRLDGQGAARRRCT